MIAWLGLGANLSDPVGRMRAATAELERAGVEIEAVSAVYRTAPRDVLDQPDFHNAACRIRCDVDPPGLLRLVQAVERRVGRAPGGRRRGPRLIDIDILLVETGVWHDDDLQVPHERLDRRRFALVPLLDLDPDLAMPDGRRLSELDDALRDDPGQRVEPVAGVTLR